MRVQTQHGRRPQSSRGAQSGSNSPRLGNCVLCANCGCGGHTFRVCDLPITSFGVVCYRYAPSGAPQFLLVQRKDSLCYVEFIRGKYTLENRGYISRLLSNMTQEERARLQDLSFDDLWCNFWQDDRSKRFLNEYNQSRTRFDTLRNGFELRSALTKEIVNVNLASLIVASGPGYDETEWGFPKGRRNIDESDNNCALREFTEETGVLGTDVEQACMPRAFEETFTGSNKVRYRHVYYLYSATAQDLLSGMEGSSPPRPVSIHQTREIRRVAWFGQEEVLARIRLSNGERRDMFKRLCLHVAALPSQKPLIDDSGYGDEDIVPS